MAKQKANLPVKSAAPKTKSTKPSTKSNKITKKDDDAATELNKGKKRHASPPPESQAQVAKAPRLLSVFTQEDDVNGFVKIGVDHRSVMVPLFIDTALSSLLVHGVDHLLSNRHVSLILNECSSADRGEINFGNFMDALEAKGQEYAVDHDSVILVKELLRKEWLLRKTAAIIEYVSTPYGLFVAIQNELQHAIKKFGERLQDNVYEREKMTKLQKWVDSVVRNLSDPDAEEEDEPIESDFDNGHNDDNENHSEVGGAGDHNQDENVQSEHNNHQESENDRDNNRGRDNRAEHDYDDSPLFVPASCSTPGQTRKPRQPLKPVDDKKLKHHIACIEALSGEDLVHRKKSDINRRLKETFTNATDLHHAHFVAHMTKDSTFNHASALVEARNKWSAMSDGQRNTWFKLRKKLVKGELAILKLDYDVAQRVAEAHAASAPANKSQKKKKKETASQLNQKAIHAHAAGTGMTEGEVNDRDQSAGRRSTGGVANLQRAREERLAQEEIAAQAVLTREAAINALPPRVDAPRQSSKPGESSARGGAPYIKPEDDESAEILHSSLVLRPSPRPPNCGSTSMQSSAFFTDSPALPSAESSSVHAKGTTIGLQLETPHPSIRSQPEYRTWALPFKPEEGVVIIGSDENYFTLHNACVQTFKHANFNALEVLGANVFFARMTRMDVGLAKLAIVVVGMRLLRPKTFTAHGAQVYVAHAPGASLDDTIVTVAYVLRKNFSLQTDQNKEYFIVTFEEPCRIASFTISIKESNGVNRHILFRPSSQCYCLTCKKRHSDQYCLENIYNVPNNKDLTPYFLPSPPKLTEQL